MAFLGLSQSANAGVWLTNDNVATEIQDGRVLALQCLDYNGGLWKFWNGPRAKSDVLNPEQGLLQIEFNGDVQRDGRQTFYLKDFKHPDNYLANGSVSWTTDKSAAAVWTAYVPVNNAANYADWTTKPTYLDKGKNTVRFDKGGSFLNTQNTGGTPNYAGGKGGYSYWFAYAFEAEEAAQFTADNLPKWIDCKFTYPSPLGEDSPLGEEGETVYFDGMIFRVFEGTDISTLGYEQYYEGSVEYFSNLQLKQMDSYIATEDNCTFPLTMTVSDSWKTNWDSFMTQYNDFYKYAHRATMNPASGESYVSFSYLLDGLRSHNTNKLFGASHMWYLEYAGLDMRGNPAVKMMSVQKYGQGIEIGEGDDSHAHVTENPTIFSFFPSSKAGHEQYDFVLGAVDFNLPSNNFLNERSATVNGVSEKFFSTWLTSSETAQGADGCQIRFTALADDEFDAYKEEVHACGYPEYLQGEGHGNGVDISDEAFAKAKETKLPEDVTKIFPENVALLQGLRTYLDYTGIAFYENRRINGANGEDDFYGIPGWVQDGEIVSLYNALDRFNVADETTWVPVSQARWNLVNAATQPAVSYDITPGAIFNMVNVDSNRGYLVNDNGELKCSVATGLNKPFDVNDKDFQFTFVKVGDNLYMYNLGAEKFMNGFGAKTDRVNAPIAEAISDHTWQFSDVPTVIRGAVAHSGDTHAFAIAGGMTSGQDAGNNTNHEGGITMLNNCVYGVIVSLGNNDREDGSGLIADYVGFVEADEYQAIVEKAEAAIAAIPTVSFDEDDIDGVVNHLTIESNALINETASDENKAKNGGGHDHIHYVLQNAERQGFEADKVYNFFVNDSEALKVNPKTQTLEVAEFTPDEPNAFNLKVAEAVAAANVYMDGPTTATYNFIHNIENEDGSENLVNMSYNGTTEHTLDMSELGKVKLGDQVFVAKAGTGDATTGITEVTSTSDVKNVYDLQGRKVAKAGKGLYIINGAKVIVK